MGDAMSTELAFQAALTPPEIKVDFKSMKEQLADYLEPYSGITPEAARSLSDSVLRDCQHELTQFHNGVEDGRKGTKREYNKNLNTFEAGCKDLLADIDKPRQVIANEIKRRQQAKRDVRYDALKQVYEEAAEALTHTVSFDDLLEPKWLNISTPYNKAESELLDKVQRVIHGWNALHATELKFPGETERIYFETLDLQKALEHDAAAFAAQQRIDATKAEVAENQAANLEAPESRGVSVLALDINSRQYDRLSEFLTSLNIIWAPLEHGLDSLDEAVNRWGETIG